MKHRLLVTTALAGLAFFAVSPAFAACDNNAPGSGATVTCAGSDTIGVNGSGLPNITVNVQAGATLHPAAAGTDAILIGLGTVNVANGATVQSTSGQAVHANGNSGFTTVNITGGTVNGGDYGIFLDNAGRITLDGAASVTGGNGTAIRTSAVDASQSTIVSLTDTTSVSGNIIAGANAADELHWVQNTNGSFATGDIGTLYQNFEQFHKDGTATTTLTGTTAANWTVGAGTLSFTDTASIADADVSSGATLDFDDVDGTYADDVSGAGDWDIRNGSNLTLTGNNTGFTGLLDIDGSNNVAFNDANALTGGDIRVNFSTVHFGSAMTANNDFIIGSGDATFNTGANNVTIAGDIGGTGGAILVKDGSGTLTLTGANTYDGGITLSQGRLIGDTDSLIGDVSNGGTLQFDQGFDATFAGDIVGTGALEKLGAGNLTLTGANTYQGGTDVQAGTLTGTTATLQGLINNDSTVVFDQVANGTYSGTMSGTGSLVKDGTGTVTLSAANTFGGGLTINAGAVTLTNVDGAGTGAITNDATLTINVTGTVDNVIAGTGGVAIAGGNTTLSGANTYSGTTTVSSGSELTATAANNMGDQSLTNDLVFNDGTLVYGAAFDQTRDVTLNGSGGSFEMGAFNSNITGNVTGTGRLEKDGTGTLTFTGAHTYTGNTSIGSGGMLVLDQSNSRTYSGTISGGGAFAKDGAGELTLAGNNISTGGLYFLGGVLQGNTLASIGLGDLNFDGGAFRLGSSYNIASDIVLDSTGTFNTNGFNATLSGVISGAGDLAKTGTGTLTLSNANTYGGILGINAGSVNVSGAAGDIAINNTGFLRGTGTVGDTTVNSGGTFSPGNSIGTMNVNGDLTFNSGSHYAVEYTATPDDSDKIIATGNVVIANGAILDLTGTNGNYFANTNYTLISAASITGGFTTVNNNLVFLDVDFDDSTATDLIMTLTRNNTSFADILNEDEVSFANAFDDLANDLTTAFTNLTAEQAQAAASSLSNEQQGAITAFAVTTNTNILTGISNRLGHSFHSKMEELSSAGQEDGTYVAAYMEPADGSTLDKETNIWFKAIGSKGRTDSSASEPSQDRYSYGALAGIDRALDDKGFYGFFAGYEFGEIETPAQGASSNVDNYHAGAYLSRPVGEGLVFNSGAAFTWHDIDTVRYVVFPGFSAAPQSDTHGYSASGFVELSKPMRAPAFDIAPFVNFTLAHSHIDGYEEQGGGLANLVVDDTTVTNPITVLGSRFSADAQWGGTQLNLFASLGWQHVFGEIQPETAMRFANGAAFFRTDGAARARDAALIDLGIDADISQAAKAFVGYNASISGSNFDHGVELGVKVKF